MTAIFQIGQGYVLYELSVSFVYTGLLVWAFPHLHRLNLSYYSKSSMLLAFRFLLICVIDPTQICLSPISLELLQLFQGIVCNNERLKGGKLETGIIGGEINSSRTSDPSLYHDTTRLREPTLLWGSLWPSDQT